MSESIKPAAEHLTDFTPPLYNVWKQQEKTPMAIREGRARAVLTESEPEAIRDMLVAQLAAQGFSKLNIGRVLREDRSTVYRLLERLERLTRRAE